MRPGVTKLAVCGIFASVALLVCPPDAHAAGANLIANPSFEVASSATRPAAWAPDSWGTNSTTFGYLTTGHTGGRSVRTTMTGYTSGDAKWAHTAVAVTAGQSYQYTAWYQSNVQTEVDVEFTLASGAVDYAYLTEVPAASAWTKVTVQYTAPAGAVSLTIFQPLARKGYLTIDDVSLTTYTPTGFTRGLVSLTFDDGWRSQYTNGLPLLNQYGMPATFYLLTGTVTYPDYLTTAMMQTIAGRGNEIAAHTVTHPHLPALSVTKIDKELAGCQTSLRGWMGPGVAKNFASPYGEYNPTVLTEVGKYYRSHRSVEEGFNSRDAFDSQRLRVQNVGQTTTPAQVGAWVDQAVRDHTWLVLVYHEVGSNLTDPTYGVTTANLNAELSLIKTKGVAVRTVDQALDEIQGQLP